MERFFVSLVVIVMLFSINNTGICSEGICNGSFEDDGYIYDITIEEPNCWDVNLPPSFDGWVGNDWATDGLYNLTFFSKKTDFEANDIAELSQNVVLGDVNQILFDIRLHTQTDSRIWDPNLRTAVVMIDDDVKWESNSVGEDVRGEYTDEVINISIGDYQEHKLSLALKCNVKEVTTTEYYTDWDNIRFNLNCDGNFLLSDFNRDCFVDANDLSMLLDFWCQVIDANSKYNLFKAYGTVNFLDYAVFANTKENSDLSDLSDLLSLTEFWLEKISQESEMNLYRFDDVSSIGLIDFYDFAVFSNQWLKSSYD